MAISCAPSEEQLVKLFKAVAAEIYNKMEKKEPYNPSGVIRTIYDKILNAPTGGEEKALYYAQEIPRLILKAYNSSEEIADFLVDSKVSSDELHQLRRDFKDLAKVKSFVSNGTGMSVKEAVTNIIEETNPSTPVIPTESYNQVEEKDKGIRATLIKAFKAFPTSALSIFNQEAKTYDGNKAEDNIPDDDPLKKAYYKLVRNLNNLIGINGNADKVKMGNTTGIFLRLVPASKVNMEDLYIEERKYLEKDEDPSAPFPYNKSSAKKLEERAASGVYLVYTDKEGNTLHFDENGNITTKEEGGKMLYTKMRLPFTPSKSDDQKGYTKGVRTLAGVQSIEDMVKKRATTPEEQDKIRQELTAVRNAEIEIIDASRKHILENPDSVVLFSIRPGSNGYVEEDFNKPNKISSINLEEGFKPTNSSTSVGLRQKGGVYFTVQDYPNPILIMRPRFSQVENLSQSLADLLFSKDFSNREKINLIKQYTYSNDTNVYEKDNGELAFKQNDTEYSAEDEANKEVFIKNINDQIVNINTRLLNGNFEQVTSENGKVTISSQNYNKFIADNFYTTLQKNSDGNILKLNAYNLIDPTPQTQEILFGKFEAQGKQETKTSSLEQSTPTDQSDDDFKKALSKLNFGLKKSLGISSSATEIQIEDARKWYTKHPMSKVVPFETLFHIVNSDAVAEFTLSGIRLFNGANYTDLYHEAWHVFSQMYLTLGDKQKLYSEARNLTGSFTTFDGRTVKFSEASDIDLEEFIAEDFRKYVLSGGKKIIDGRSSRNNIFKKIYNVIKNMFKGYSYKDALADQEATGTIKELYDKLRFGNINEYKPSLNNVQFSLLNKGMQVLNASDNKNEGLSYQDSAVLVETMDSLIASNLAKADLNVGAIFTRPEVMNLVYQQVKKDLVAIRNSMQAKLDSTDENVVITDSEKNALNALNTALDNWGDYNSVVAGEKNGMIAYHKMRSSYITFEDKFSNLSLEEKIEALDENPEGKIDGEELKKSEQELQEEFGTNAFENRGDKTSVFEMASNEVVYLIKSLPAVDKSGKPITNVYGVSKLVDFNSTWGKIINITQGKIGESGMYAALDKQSTTYPELKELVNRLGDPSKKTQTSDWAYVNMWGKFHRDFSVYEVPVKEVRVVQDASGNFRVDFTESAPKFKQVERSFISDFESSKSKYITKKDSGTEINIPVLLKDFPSRDMNTDKAFEFLRAIGLNLTDNKAVRKELSKYSVAISYIYDGVTSGKETGNPIKFKDISGRIKEILIIESKYSGKYTNNSIELPTGDTAYDLSLNNTITQQLKELNDDDKVYSSEDPNSPEAGIVNQPHMSHFNFRTNPFAKTSIWLNSMFNIPTDVSKLGHINDANKRRPESSKTGSDNVKLQIVNLAGIKNVITTALGVQTSTGGIKTNEVDINTKFIMDVHTMLLQGVIELPRHASKSTSYGIALSRVYTNHNQTIDTTPGKTPLAQHLYISSGHFATDRGMNAAVELMKGKLSAELERIAMLRDGLVDNVPGFNERGQELTIFDDILKDDLKKKLIAKANASDSATMLDSEEFRDDVSDGIKNYFEKLYQENLEFFNLMPYMSGDVINKTRKLAKLDAGKTLSDKEAMELAIKSFTVNAFIHNTETVSVLYGDLAGYNHLKEEFHKRNAAIGSTGRIFSTDQSKYDFLNNLGNAYAKSIGVEHKTFDGKLRTAIFKDRVLPSVYHSEYVEALMAKGRTREEAEKILEPYTKMNTGDAQGWITFDAYRNLSILESNWSNEQNELYIKIINKEKIDPSEIAEYFPPRKFQYAGPVESKNLHIQAFHKFSLAPLVPSVIEDTHMQTLHDNLVKQGFDYALFESGSKLGTITKNGSFDNLYEEDNTIRAWDGKPENGYTANNVYLQYLKNQVDINSTWKNKTIFSTQLRTLIINDLFKRGLPLNADFQGMVKNFENLLDDYQKLKKEELLKDMGWKMVNGKPSGNIESLVKFIRKEFTRQSLADHQIDFIDINASTKQLTNDLSLSLNAEKIEKLLNAIVIKRLVRQKLNGEQLVQLASPGFESKNKFRAATDEEAKKYNGTNDLPTYRPGKIIDLDIKYSKFSKEQLKATLKELEDKSNLATYGSESYRRVYQLEKQYLQDKIDGKKPQFTKVQDPTTAMKIKVALKGEFYKLLDLKHNDGKKIGDIDRLNEMLRNDEWLDKGNNRKMITMTAVRIPVQGFNSMEFMEVYQFLPEEAGNVLIPPAEIVAKSGGDFDIDKLTVMMPNIGSDINTKQITATSLKALQEKYPGLDLSKDNVNIILDASKNNFEDYQLTAADQKVYNVLQSEFSTPFYHTSGTKGMENKIIESIRGILEHPDNFEALIRPNDTDLVKGVADQLADENIQGFDPFANKTNPIKIIKTKDGKDKKIISPTRVLEPRYNLYKHESNNIGKKSLGIGAVDNGYSSIFKRIGLYLNSTYTKYKMNSDGSLKTKFGKPDKQVRPVNIRMQHNTVEINGKKLISLSDVDTVTKDKISDLISQLMNGWVDIEKDAWIFNINGNNIAGPVMLFMLEAGVDFKTAAHFVSQPLVVEYIKERMRMESPFYAASTQEERIDKGLIPTQARINMFLKYGLNDVVKTNKEGNVFLSGKELYKTIDKYTSGVTFNLENLQTIIKNKTDNITDNARAGLLHFIELEEMCKQLTGVKLTVNVDTKPTKTLHASQEKLGKIADLERTDIIDNKFITKIQTDSPKSSFFVQDFQLSILRPLMSLRGNEAINNHIINIIRGFGNKKTFEDKEKFAAAFHNDIPLYILQNHIKNIDVFNLKEYNGLPINTKMPVEKVVLRQGAFVKDGVMYVDAKQIEQDFKTKAYAGEGYKNLGLQVLPVAAFQTVKGDNNQQNFKEYAHFVLEREYLRATTPVAEGQSREKYELDIADRAMRKTFNFYYMLKSNSSMANQFNQIKNKYPDLVRQYMIFDALATPTDSRDKSMKTLKLRSSRLDASLTNTLHENLVALSDFSKVKVADPVANREISNFFSRLIIGEFLRTGIAKGNDSLAPILPYNTIMSLLKEPIERLKANGGFTQEMLDSYTNLFNQNWDMSRNVKNKFRNYIDPNMGVTSRVVESEEVEQPVQEKPEYDYMYFKDMVDDVDGGELLDSMVDDSNNRWTDLMDDEDSIELARDTVANLLGEYSSTLERIRSAEAALAEGDTITAQKYSKMASEDIDSYIENNDIFTDYFEEDSPRRALEIKNTLEHLVSVLTDYSKIFNKETNSMSRKTLKSIGNQLSSYNPPSEISATKKMLQDNPNDIFIFPSNTENVSENNTKSYYDANNASGIPVKVNRTDFMTDATYDENVKAINTALDNLESHVDDGGKINFPSAGITSAAKKDSQGNIVRTEMLKKTGPRTYTHLVTELYNRFGYIHPGAEEDLGFRESLQSNQEITDKEVDEIIKQKFEESKTCNQ